MRIVRGALTACCLLLVGAGAAQAHFVWAAVAPDAAGKPAAQLWFSEGAAPGEANLVAKIGHSKAWRRDAQGNVTDLELREEQASGGAALVSTLADEAPCSVEAECIYGIFDRGQGPMMLEYYARSLHGATPAELNQFGRAERLTFDVAPEFVDGNKVKLNVQFKGSPAADTEVSVIGPNDEDLKLKTDAAGQCEFDAKASGVYAVRAFRNEPDADGEHDGKPYHGVRRYSTLTFELASNATPSTADAPAKDANQVLAHAREQRALWDGFPGFESVLLLQDGEHSVEGKVKVTADGEVELTGYGDMNLGWARGQLESMVQHRFSGNGPESEVEFVEETVAHPLGTLLRFKNDPEMLSAYRINGDVIAQVNRQMGKSRFSINVIEVHRNPEGKYLPSVFQVNFWDVDGGALKSSMSCYNSWQRVGEYDLPNTFAFIDAGDNKNEVRKMIFQNPTLLTE
jgi:hypothetical protein